VPSARSSATRPSWRQAAARSERERAFYDAEAAARRPGEPDSYDAALLEALGPVAGLQVLELGCGAGDLSVQLLGRGARLTALDVSRAMLELARRRAPEARFLAAPAEETGLPEESFDRVVGKWVLHHVDVEAAAREVRRVLRPGGRAVFFENQDRNPLLRAARRRLWGARGVNWVGTPDEHPLTRDDLHTLARTFDAVELSYPSFYLFEALSRAMGHRFHAPLQRLDSLIWRRLPAARPWSWHVLIEAKRR
jgi:ubiquinone/menaquinone biosynthesis C-methylase UbiE